LKFARYGDAGIFIDLGLPPSARRTETTLRVQRTLLQAFPEADVVSGVGVVCLFALPKHLEFQELEAVLAHLLEDTEVPRHHKLPIVYDGPDLLPCAEALGLDAQELVALHAAARYEVELLGFLPGFAYLGPLPARLVLPRRVSPRSRVPAGSLAMAAHYTAIYPFSSPGGWHLLGRSLGPAGFDPRRSEPFLFRPGDRVQFEPVSEGNAPRASGRVLDIRLSLAQREMPWLLIESTPPLTTLQDCGRPHCLGQGLPESGPLDPESFQESARAVHNSITMAALEIAGGVLRFRAMGRPWLGLESGPFRPEEGETIEIDARVRPRYLSIEGGFEGSAVLGSRSTHFVAGFGGHEGRALRARDILTPAPASLTRPSLNESSIEFAEAHPAYRTRTSCDPEIADAPRTLTLRLSPGPHLGLFSARALETLLGSEYRVAKERDRTGVRLEGPALDRVEFDEAAPIPMIRGSIQVPKSGQPIILGPDHPITGGYPVVAVLGSESFGTLARATPLDALRFEMRSESK